jgi:cation:H+ antiporter
MVIALMLLAGLVALYFGAEWLVRGGASLAVRLGVTPLLVGLTVVAYGTSTPELIVSSMAAAKGQGAIAIGNVVGSNIYNILAILGVSGVIAPPINGQGVSLTDTLVMIGISLVLLVIAWTGFKLRRWEGALLLALYGGYLWHLWPKT